MSIYELVLAVVSWVLSVGVAWFVIRWATKTKKVLADLEEIKQLLKQHNMK